MDKLSCHDCAIYASKVPRQEGQRDTRTNREVTRNEYLVLCFNLSSVSRWYEMHKAPMGSA